MGHGGGRHPTPGLHLEGAATCLRHDTNLGTAMKHVQIEGRPAMAEPVTAIEYQKIGNLWKDF